MSQYFNSARLNQIEANVKRLQEEHNKPFLDRLALATAKAKAIAERNALEQHIKDLDAKIKAIKEEIANNIEIKQYVKAGSSDGDVAAKCTWQRHTKHRGRIHEVTVKVKYVPYIKLFGNDNHIVEITEEEVPNFKHVYYKKIIL